MTAYEMAKMYYPKLWDDKRIDALVKAGKLTKKQADEIRSTADGEYEIVDSLKESDPLDPIVGIIDDHNQAFA